MIVGAAGRSSRRGSSSRRPRVSTGPRSDSRIPPHGPMTVAMELLAAISTSYAIGQVTGLVVLAVVFGWLALRACGALPRNGGQVPPALSASSSAPVGSIAPPGHVPSPASAIAASPAPPTVGRARRGRTTDAVAALVAAALLLGGIIHATSGRGSSSPWASGEGLNEKAGFMAGCGQTAHGLVDCGCVFSYITSRSPYDTPAGFTALAPAVERFNATRDPGTLPTVYLGAIRTCIRTHA